MPQVHVPVYAHSSFYRENTDFGAYLVVSRDLVFKKTRKWAGQKNALYLEKLNLEGCDDETSSWQWFLTFQLYFDFQIL